MLRKIGFEDSDSGEVELRLAVVSDSDLGQKINGAPKTAKKLLNVEAHSKSLKVIEKSSGAVLYSAEPLWESIEPSETAWYLDFEPLKTEQGTHKDPVLVITLSKKEPKRKWLEMTSADALEKRFGPIRTTSDASAEASSKDPDGAAAWNAREKVKVFLTAAQNGDIEAFRQAALELEKSEEKPVHRHDGREQIGATELVNSEQDDQEMGDHSENILPERESLAETEASKGVADPLPSSILAVRDGNGRCALHFAASKGHIPFCEFWTSDLNLPVDVKDDDGETPLTLAAREGHVSTVNWLLDHGADVAAANEKSSAQAIHHAAGHGNLPIVSLLLERGSFVDASSDAGPPLVWACGHGHSEVAAFLLEKGANPNALNEDGVGALMTSAVAEEEGIVRMLLRKGADANLKVSSGGGITALFVACDQGSEAMVKALIEGGADPNIRDEEGHLPLEVAADKGHKNIVEILFPLTTPKEDLEDWSIESLMRRATRREAERKESPIDSSADDKNVRKKEDETELLRSLLSKKRDLNKDEESALKKKKERGDASFKKGGFLKAVQEYTQAIALDPCNATLYSNRALCHLKLKDGEKALGDATLARLLRPDWSKALYREGCALRVLGLFEEAASCFFEGLKLEPNSKELAEALRETVAAGRRVHLSAAGVSST